MLFILASLASCSFYLPHEEKTFLSWMRSNNQFYTGDEYHLRFGIFLTNLRRVKEYNSGDRKFRVGLNKFAVLTPSEYKSYHKLIPKSMPKATKNVKPSKRTNSDSFDWREKGVVSPIQDYGSCVADWAFSVVQVAESANAISTQTLLKFSEQQLIDCVDLCGGCSMGSAAMALVYTIDYQNGQYCLASDYKFTGTDGQCRYDEFEHYGSVTNYIQVRAGQEPQLAEYIETYGPAVVSIDASNWSFQLYTEGIYDEPNCDPVKFNLDCSCVGFGVENDTKYWIVRNSWGKAWGEAGYIRMLKDHNDQCAIATLAFCMYC